MQRRDMATYSRLLEQLPLQEPERCGSPRRACDPLTAIGPEHTGAIVLSPCRNRIGAERLGRKILAHSPTKNTRYMARTRPTSCRGRASAPISPASGLLAEAENSPGTAIFPLPDRNT